MAPFGDDPELVAIFRTEVEGRLAALSSGLLALESAPDQRELLTSLCRDAHTVKGSARMLGLDPVVRLAHGAEDVLAAMRDGRASSGREQVDLLLAACDAITAALPGSGRPEPPTDELVAGLEEAARRGAVRAGVASAGGAGGDPGPGADPVADPYPEDPAPVSPTLPAARTPERAPARDDVRVSGPRVRAILDAVGEAELGGRRLQRVAGEQATLAGTLADTLGALRRSTGVSDAGVALDRLTALADQLLAGALAERELAEDHGDRLGLVRAQALGLAMVPVRHLLAGFPRLVRVLARGTGKEVRVVLSGEEVELDKQVLDAVADALTHLVTNAVDHGVEPASDRVAAGKPPLATIGVRVRGAGGTVTIEVSDDGRGVDLEAVRVAAVSLGLPADPDPLALVFAPALSTRAAVSTTSGRGMGLDAVRSAVEGIGGSVAVASAAGQGTTFTLTVPVTLGLLRCLMVRAGGERYAVPVGAVVETLLLRDLARHDVGGAPMVVREGQTLPLVDLGVALGAAATPVAAALITRHAGQGAVAWAVEALEGEGELVVGHLGEFLAGRVPWVSGTTIDTDGRVVCVLDLREVASAAAIAPEVAESAPPRVVVVEDSVGVRELERAILEGAGYVVETAADGAQGAALLAGPPPDLLLTDVEMPGLDGFSLTRAVRANAAWAQVPVVIVTSCGSDEDKREGVRAGASAYLLKSEFDQTQLIETVRRLVGR